MLFKKLLDIGARTLLVPYVSTAEEARKAVAAIRYPTSGMRGVAGTTRATRYGRNKGYVTNASDELCLLVRPMRTACHAAALPVTQPALCATFSLLV